MAHKAQILFFNSVKRKYPKFFRNVTAVDFGSLNISGDNRYLFEGGKYTGVDLAPGPNVDVTCLAHEYDAPDASVHTVLSANMLEHDKYYSLTLWNMYRILVPGGLFLLSCATGRHKEHGTLRRKPEHSPFTTKIAGWESYYKNLSEADFRAVLDVDKLFRKSWINTTADDLQFVGFKRMP